MKKVMKRNGDIVEYNLEKISIAIAGAFEDLGREFDDTFVLDDIEENIMQLPGDTVSVESIQDIVQRALIENGYVEEAIAYIRYRTEHELQRRKVLEQEIAERLMASDVQNQNANIDEYSFGGRKGEADAAFMKRYALDNLVSKMARENHENNEIYIHDLDSYAVGMHNCLTMPFDDLLANGFNTRQTDVRPANSVNTAFQLIAVLFQLQSLQQFGGVAASHLDWTMVPYVRKSFYKHFVDGIQYAEGMQGFLHLPELMDSFNDGMSIEDPAYKELPKAYEYAQAMIRREVHQGVEGMYHNLNTLQSRSGNQLPFTSINYGTCTLPEGRLVTEELLNVSIEGLGKLRKTSIFPCGIFKLKKGVNRAPGDPNYDLFQLALKSTALRLYPNYANVDWSGNAGYDENDPCQEFATMGCRTANGFDINGFGQLKDGRGNICPVTIILPTLAMEAGGNVDTFFTLLDKKIEEAKDMLIERFEWICSQDPRSATFMWENGTMKGYIPEEGPRSALKHGTLAMGTIGYAETLQILCGENQLGEKGMKLAKKISARIQEKCKEYKEQYKLNFALYYTPAENLCYTAMKKFRAKYGIIPNISDHEYFTNSIHVPVWEEIDPFEKIDIESQLTGYSGAGCITYVELDSAAIHNTQALETIVNYAMDKDIPYFALNLSNDTCLNCGFTTEMGDTCPVCGSSNIQRLRRVTGYLTGNYTTAFNLGKQAEVRDRFSHVKKLKEWKEDES